MACKVRLLRHFWKAVCGVLEPLIQMDNNSRNTLAILIGETLFLYTAALLRFSVSVILPVWLGSFVATTMIAYRISNSNRRTQEQRQGS